MKNKSVKILIILICILFQNYHSIGQIDSENLHLQRSCGTESPGEQYEKWFSGKVVELKRKRLAGKGSSQDFTIPIVVHVLHSGLSVGTSENISLAQIQSQISILNQDFSGTNADIINVPSEFQAIKSGNTGIQFCLAKQTPNGIAMQEYGVDRINWQSLGWTNPSTLSNSGLRTYFNDVIKPATIWDPTKYLNIWLAQIDNSGLLGYATYPVGTGLTDIVSSLETSTTSGVVMHHKAWGNIGTAATGNFNKGRTATHEIGHWLGVYHTFQGGCAGEDASNCNSSGDYCCDTPPTSNNNFGCPSTQNTCVESPVDKNDMTMNFMEYVYDACMYMFTLDQTTRMQTAMANGTYRAPLNNSTVCVELKPDLTILNPQLSQTTVTSGNPVIVNFVINNIHTGYANPSVVNFYFSTNNLLTPGTNGDVLLGQYNYAQILSPLSQTGTLSKEIIIPDGLNTGSYYVFVVADGNSLIIEQSESNNQASVPINVQFACVSNLSPTISIASTTISKCFNASVQTTALTYSAVTNSPNTYSITWNTLPTNNLLEIVDAPLSSSPIIISIPAGLAAGTYSGTITVKNANGCVSSGNTFSLTINPNPTISSSAAFGSRCFSALSQASTMPYSATTFSPNTYSITWNASPTNSFTNINNAPLPASPIPFTIPASTNPGTYTGNIIVTNSNGCSSIPKAFSLTILSLPTITIPASTNSVCLSNTTQVASLPYSATTQSPNKYGITWSTVPTNSFTSVSNITLPISPITITVPAGTNSGTYSGNLKVKNANGCESVEYPFSLQVLPLQNFAADTSVKLLCSEDVIDLSGFANIPGLTKTWSIPNPVQTPLGKHSLVLSNSGGCIDTVMVNIYQDINKWTGNASNSWTNPLNWSTTKVPNDSTHVVFVGKRFNSCLLNSEVNVASVQVLNNAVITVSNSRKLNVKGKCLQIPLITISPAILTTTLASAITSSTVITGGIISSSGGTNVTARGVCFNTSPNPTISNDYTLEGSGIGEFISELSSLEPNTQYYVRAFAINADGVAYGNEITFTTLP